MLASATSTPTTPTPLTSTVLIASLFSPFALAPAADQASVVGADDNEDGHSSNVSLFATAQKRTRHRTGSATPTGLNGIFGSLPDLYASDSPGNVGVGLRRRMAATINGSSNLLANTQNLSTIDDERLADPSARPWRIVPSRRGNVGLHNAVNSIPESELPRLWVGCIGSGCEAMYGDGNTSSIPFNAQSPISPSTFKAEVDKDLLDEHRCLNVELTDAEIHGHYHNFCKQILWPLFHSQAPNYDSLSRFESTGWNMYKQVNAKFADVIARNYKPGDLVWVNGYHLMLVPEMLRKRLPNIVVGFFFHIPFPSSEFFRCLHVRKEILQGLLGANLIGFQTYSYTRHFLQACSQILAVQTSSTFLHLENTVVSVGIYPIGIDTDRLNIKRGHPDVLELVQQLSSHYRRPRRVSSHQHTNTANVTMGGLSRVHSRRNSQQPQYLATAAEDNNQLHNRLTSSQIQDEHVGIKQSNVRNTIKPPIISDSPIAFPTMNTTTLSISDENNETFELKVIVARDKLDYIKGVRQKLLAYELFLETYPEWIGRVVLIQVVLSTATHSKYAAEVSDIVSRINSCYGKLEYTPVVYLRKDISYNHYLALLSIADACLITSLRDGMNLTSHEYIVCQETRKSPLILSEFAGTYGSFGDALRINPWDYKETAAAINEALSMSEEEKSERWHELYRTVTTNTAQAFVTSFVSELRSTVLTMQHCFSMHHIHLDNTVDGMNTHLYRSATRRAFVFEYDGTLVPYEQAKAPEVTSKTTNIIPSSLMLSTTFEGTPAYTLAGTSSTIPSAEKADIDDENTIKDPNVTKTSPLTTGISRVVNSVHGHTGHKQQIVELLSLLAADARNIVCVISGRTQNSLAQIFENAPKVILGAENGGFMRDKGIRSWTTMLPHANLAWKTAVKDIFQFYVERTPGSYIEEKSMSLVWHYSNADPSFGFRQAMECQTHIEDTMGSTYSIHTVRGRMNVEVMPRSMNKSLVVKRLLQQYSDVDFALAIGGHRTDEDVFTCLNNHAKPRSRASSTSLSRSSSFTGSRNRRSSINSLLNETTISVGPTTAVPQLPVQLPFINVIPIANNNNNSNEDDSDSNKSVSLSSSPLNKSHVFACTVGCKSSEAQYYVDGVDDVHRILGVLCQSM